MGETPRSLGPKRVDLRGAGLRWVAPWERKFPKGWALWDELGG